MPRYRVEALEKVVVRTFYDVEATRADEAEAFCKADRVAYDNSVIEEGDEEWIETVSVEETPHKSA